MTDKQKPAFILLNKDRETKKSQRIGAFFPNKYGGDDLTLSIWNPDTRERSYARTITFSDGTTVDVGFLNRRENTEYKEKTADDEL